MKNSIPNNSNIFSSDSIKDLIDMTLTIDEQLLEEIIKPLSSRECNPCSIDTQLPKNNAILTENEINAIYCCISFAQDLRDAFDEGLVEGKWDSEGDDQSKRDWLSKNIGTALMAAHKLSGYKQNIYTKGK